MSDRLPVLLREYAAAILFFLVLPGLRPVQRGVGVRATLKQVLAVQAFGAMLHTAVRCGEMVGPFLRVIRQCWRPLQRTDADIGTHFVVIRGDRLDVLRRHPGRGRLHCRRFRQRRRSGRWRGRGRSGRLDSGGGTTSHRQNQQHRNDIRDGKRCASPTFA